MFTATKSYPLNSKQSITLLSGASLIARSSFLFTPEGYNDSVEGCLGIRIAYSIPRSIPRSRSDDQEDLDVISLSDLNLMPLTFSITEKLPWIKYHDAWHFTGPNLDSHGWAHIPNWASIPLTCLNYDESGHEDDRKIDRLGLLISKVLKHAETKGLLISHPILRNHPVYTGLRNNTYCQTRSQVQIPDEYLKFLEHKEIPLEGELVTRRYDSWIFPPEGNSSVSDLELKIGLAKIDEDLDSLLPELLPTKMQIRETFLGDLRGKICIDDYLIAPNGFGLSHTYYNREKDGKEETGRNRTFSKMGDYDVPISIMLQPKLPKELEEKEIIQQLRDRRFIGGKPNLQNTAA